MEEKDKYQKIEEIISSLTDEQTDDLISQLYVNMEMFFATKIFEPTISKISLALQEKKDLTVQTLVIESLKELDSSEIIINKLENELVNTDNLVLFAEECVASLLFNVEESDALRNKIKEVEMSETDFFETMIEVYAEDFIEEFKTYDLEEWKREVVQDLSELFSLEN